MAEKSEYWEYTTEPMDSLPSIAEAWGHSGEWMALAEQNPDLPDPHNIQPGMPLMIPAEWVTESPPVPVAAETTATTTDTPENPPEEVIEALESVESEEDESSSRRRGSRSH